MAHFNFSQTTGKFINVLDPILPDMLRDIEESSSFDDNLTALQNIKSLNYSVYHDNKTKVINWRSSWSLNVQLGVMVAAKPGTEMISNIVVGLLVDR